MLDPYSLAPAQIVQETKTFTDTKQPGANLELTFRVETGIDVEFAVRQKRAGYIRDYLTGRDGVPVQLPPIDGKRVTPSEQLFTWISTFEVMQVPPDGEPPYDLTAWLYFVVRMPDAVRQAVEWADTLIGEANATTGEGSSPTPDTTPASP